jgi:hypothetical protein
MRGGRGAAERFALQNASPTPLSLLHKADWPSRFIPWTDRGGQRLGPLSFSAGSCCVSTKEAVQYISRIP